MKRRDFVSVMLGVAARGAEERVRMAFFGIGHAHAWEKLRIVRESAQWELAGVWAEDEELRRKCEQAGVRLLEQRQLLGDASIRVVAVESEVKGHARHARLALEAGKHVHVEKPPATNLGDFRALMAVAARRKLLVQVGYMWRFHPGFAAALEAARKGWLGEIYLARGTINTKIPPEGRVNLAQFRGGQMFELGCHLIDPLVRLLGRPRKVTPVLGAHGRFADGLAGNTVAVLEYEKALGVITSATLQPGAGRHRSFEIFGTNGTAVLRPIEPGKLEIDLAEAVGPYRAGVQPVALAPYRRYEGEFEELAGAVRGRARLRVTPEEEERVQEAVLRASGML